MTRQGHALRRARSLGRDERLIAALADTDPGTYDFPKPRPTTACWHRCIHCDGRYDVLNGPGPLPHRPGCAWVGAHQRLGRPLPEGHTTQEDQP